MKIRGSEVEKPTELTDYALLVFVKNLYTADETRFLNELLTRFEVYSKRIGNMK